MFYIGLAILGIGITLYVVHTIIYNHYLRKNKPGLLEQFDSIPKGKSRSRKAKGKKPEIRVVVTESGTPGWVMLLLIPAMPLAFLGIMVIILSLIIKIIRWIF